MVEDAGAELAQQGGVELCCPVDEDADGLVGGFRAGGGVHGLDRGGDDADLLHVDRPADQGVAHAGWGGVEGRGELDQAAGDADAEA